MDTRSGYKKQQKLSSLQFFTEIPDFLTLLISVILSRSLLVLIDLLDSFGELIKSSMTALLSKKLSKDLRFKYNYGIGKVESVSALICEGIIILGVCFTLALSVYELFFPNKPSDFLIFVVGLKLVHISLDVFFLIKQRKIKKSYCSALVKANYISSIASLLFDTITFISLLAVWLFRNNPIGLYITPIITIIIAIYLLIGCILRTKSAIDEITDKTLPENIQLKILSIMAQYFPRYSNLCSVQSRKIGNSLIVDLHLLFHESTTFKEISDLRKDIQSKINKHYDNCIVNIVVNDGDQNAIDKHFDVL